MDAKQFSSGVIAAMECAEDFATAHCIEAGATAILILRDDRGAEYRRLIGPKGPSEIPPGFDDTVVLARLAAKRHATPADLLAMDATIAEAQAAGERVVVIEPGQRAGPY